MNRDTIHFGACRRSRAGVAFRLLRLTCPGDPVNSTTEAAYRRAPQLTVALTPSSMQWLAALPASVRPRHLPIKFVRIANRLAEIWGESHAGSRYFQDLLIDRRGGRQGFPNEVGAELAALQDYFETKVHARPQTVWDQIAGHRRDG